MAHRIISKPHGIVLSSALGDIAVEVEGTYVDVSLRADGYRDILAERYYAYGGTVTLCELGSLIEAEMRCSGQTFADFTLSVYTDTPGNKADSCVLHILYCDRFTICSDIQKFLSENFLTTLSYRRVAPGSTESLFFFAAEGESVAYTISYQYRKSGSNALYHHSFTVDAGKTASSASVVQINIAQSSIVADAASHAAVRPSEVELLSFTVYLGQRSITFFVDPSLGSDPSALGSFVFRNCFNVLEVAALAAVTTAKTDVDRSTAIVNGRSQFYNQSSTKSYEVETAPLTSDEAEWIDQLFTSHDVFRIEPDPTNEYDPLVLAAILITDSTCEIQDGDEKLNKVKFTWRYADNRPLVRLSASPGIFTSPYNIVYT